MDKLITDIDTFLLEGTFEKSNKLTRAMISKINKEIIKFLEPTYFVQIPLGDICQILNKYNIVLLQEDDTEWEGFLLGGTKKTEQIWFELGWMNTMDSDRRYQKIKNTGLALSYYKMPSGKWEVIGYLT